MKQCYRCGEIKDEREFHKNKTKKDNINIYCKECIRKYGKEYRYERKDILATKKREYTLNNKKHKSEYDKKHYAKNAELRKEYAKNYRESNRGKVAEGLYNWRVRNAVLKRETDKIWKNSDALYESYGSKLGNVEETRDNGTLLEVRCTYCNRWFIPKNKAVQQRLRSINGTNTGENRLYCSDECKQACPIFGVQLYERGTRLSTSRETPAEFRKMALEDRDYTCEKCGSTENGLHVHHIEGYTEQPMLMADLCNVLVVCKKCHKEIHKQPGCSYYDYKPCKV